MHIRKFRNHAISAAATLAITWTAAFSAFAATVALAMCVTDANAATLSPTTAHDDIPGDATLKEIVEGAGATEALEAEAKERKAADAALQTNVTATATAISDEATARKDADSALVSSLSDLSDALTDEKTDRIMGDNDAASAIGATAKDLSEHVSTTSGNPHGVTAADVKVSLVPQTETQASTTTNDAGEVVTTVATNATGKATVSVGDDSATFYTADEADEKHNSLAEAISDIPVPGDGKLTIVLNGKTNATFSANSATNTAVAFSESDPQFTIWTNSEAIVAGKDAAAGRQAVGIGRSWYTPDYTGARAGDFSVAIYGDATNEQCTAINGSTCGGKNSIALNGVSFGDHSTAINNYWLSVDDDAVAKREAEAKPLTALGVYGSFDNFVFDFHTNVIEDTTFYCKDGGEYSVEAGEFVYAYTKTLPEAVRDYSAVSSVNSQTGAVVLAASDVGAVATNDFSAATNGLASAASVAASITSATNGLASAAALSAHASATNNPHNVTAAQLGARDLLDLAVYEVATTVTTNVETGAVATNTAVVAKSDDAIMTKATLAASETDPEFATWKGNTRVVLGSRAEVNYSSVAIGESASASGIKSVAIGGASSPTGHDTIARGDWAVALGCKARAVGAGSVALGANVSASGEDAVAVNGHDASGINSVAVGVASAAVASNATAIGCYSYAVVPDSFALRQAPDLIYLGSHTNDLGSTARTLQSYLDERATTNALAAVKASIPAISATDATFSNAVLQVGIGTLGITTNDLQVVHDLAELPVGTSITTVGGLLAALAAGLAALKKKTDDIKSSVDSANAALEEVA